MDTVLFVDDRPNELAYEIFRMPDIRPILLRFDDVELPEDYKDHTVNKDIFIVKNRSESVEEAIRFEEWVHSSQIFPRYFINPSEPAQYFGHRFARQVSLPSLSEEVLERVRNKLTLKTCLYEAGIQVAPFREVRSIEQIVAFGNTFGWPVVVKPIDGWSTINTFKLEQHEASLFSFPLSPVQGISNRWLVEKFISWREWECCALVKDGIVLQEFISYMPFSPLQIVDGALNANITLTEKDKNDLSIHAHSFVQNLVTQVGITTGYVHIEFFLSPEGDVLVGDVGNRLAGCEIPANHAHTFNFNIFRSLIDIHLDRSPKISHMAERNVGDLLLPPLSDSSRALPHEQEFLSFPGVIEVKFRAKGAAIAKAYRSSHASSVALHVEGASVPEVEERMSKVFSWFNDLNDRRGE